jgi:hypothetical protein
MGLFVLRFLLDLLKNNNMKSILLICTIFLFSGFVQKNENYHVECYNLNSTDYIELKVWSDAKKYSTIKAEKNAIHALLYSGVSGGNNCITQKPILTSEEYRNEFKKIERKFFSRKGNWKMYIKSSTFVKDNTKTNYYIVSVSKQQLINFLIEKKIIKSLTNGF